MKQAHLLGLTDEKYCPFCKIVRKEAMAHIVYENENFLVFLDTKPLFYGHCLLIPKNHVENFHKLSPEKIPELFQLTQVLSKAIEESMNAEGTFIAINNKVSQSVPHLHIHISPRRFKDGLKGFFWPRHPYLSNEQMVQVKENISTALKKYLN